MHPKEILFSVNEYDRDGDVTEEGIFLHFGGTRVKAAENIGDFRAIVDCMKSMVREIDDYYTRGA
jgi:hypothetical protein